MDPRKTESSLEFQCPKRDSVVILDFTREHLVPLSFIYCLKSLFFYVMNVSAVLWLTGNKFLTLMFFFLLASSLESLATNIKVMIYFQHLCQALCSQWENMFPAVLLILEKHSLSRVYADQCSESTVCYIVKLLNCSFFFSSV